MRSAFIHVQAPPSRGDADAAGGRTGSMLRRCAWGGAVFTVAVLALAAAVRWQAFGALPDAPVLAGIRTAHRLAAMAVTACAVGVAAAAVMLPPYFGVSRYRTAAMLAGVCVLAVLGRWSGPSAAEGVVLANAGLGLGLAMVFASLAASPGRLRPVRLRETWAKAGAAGLLVLASGAWAGVSRWAANCTAWVWCETAAPLPALVVAGHRIAGAAIIAVVLVWGLRQWRQPGSRTSAALAAAGVCLVAGATGGLAALGIGDRSAMAVAHHGAAALLAVAGAAAWTIAVARRRLDVAQAGSAAVCGTVVPDAGPKREGCL